MSEKHKELVTANNNFSSVLAGALIGGLAGAVTMFLLAPQSGEKTRMQIQEKSVELRDLTTGFLEGAIEQVRADGIKIAIDGSQKAKELLQHGQSLVAEQLDNVSEAALAARDKTSQAELEIRVM